MLLHYLRSAKRKITERLDGSHNECTRRLLQAQEDLINNSNNKIDSIFFFTTHKCASTFITKALPLLCKDANRSYFDFSTRIWNLGNKISLRDPFDLEHCEYLYKRYGEVYGPLRTPIDIPLVNECNNILFLRNPLDLLISSYYSIAFSHGLPKNTNSRNDFLKDRSLALEEGIDQYVLREAETWIIPHFGKFSQLKRRAKRCTILNYDTFFYDFDAFYDQLIKSLEVNPSISVKEKLYLLAKKPFKNVRKDGSQQNIYSHHRSGESKQYLTKIKPETYNRLTELLQPVLEEFDFH